MLRVRRSKFAPRQTGLTPSLRFPCRVVALGLRHYRVVVGSKMGLLPPRDVIARIVLLPVLLWQGLRIRRTALVLPEADGPRFGVAGQGRPLRLLVVGDSSAAGVGVEQQDDALVGQTLKHLTPHFEVTWRLIAVTGATTKSTLAMLKADRLQNTDRFDAVVVALGVNDAVRLRPIKTWVRRARAVREMLKTQYGAKLLVIPGVPPISDFPALTPLLRWTLGEHAKRLDKALAEDLRDEPAIEYVPFNLRLDVRNMAVDGYHPNEAGYAYCGKMASARILAHFHEETSDS